MPNELTAAAGWSELIDWLKTTWTFVISHLPDMLELKAAIMEIIDIIRRLLTPPTPIPVPVPK